MCVLCFALVLVRPRVVRVRVRVCVCARVCVVCVCLHVCVVCVCVFLVVRFSGSPLPASPSNFKPAVLRFSASGLPVEL